MMEGELWMDDDYQMLRVCYFGGWMMVGGQMMDGELWMDDGWSIDGWIMDDDYQMLRVCYFGGLE